MRVCSVKGCEKEYHARGYCKLHYDRLPEIKARNVLYSRKYNNKPDVIAHRKEYYQREDVKEKHRVYAKEYYSRPEVKEKGVVYRKKYYARFDVKERMRCKPPSYVVVFFSQFNRNKAWRRDGLEKMSELFANVTCGLSGQEACDLQEKILKQAKVRLKPSLRGKE